MEAQTPTLSSRANPDGPYRLVAATGLHAIFFTENRTRRSDSKPRMGRPGKPRDLQFLSCGNRALSAQVMANIGAADPEDDIFRDVGRVVGNPLQVAGDH